MQPDTIVLVHGFWVTPRAWENWIAHYENKGFRVIAPPYPGFQLEVEALNADPTPIETVTVPAIISALEKIITELDRPPVIMGHSAGGAFTQILLDRGFGAAGVAINSAPTEGVAVVPLSQVRSTFPVLKNPANRHRAVGFDYDHWRYAGSGARTSSQPPSPSCSPRRRASSPARSCASTAVRASAATAPENG
jgi:pimeloyl-ACP methyl ester carboxylesterase